MATNPRPKNPNETALSAVEDALRLDYAPDAAPSVEPEDTARRDRRTEPRAPSTEAPRRGAEQQRRSEAPRPPAPPPRRAEAAPSAPPPRREEPRRNEGAGARAFADAAAEADVAPTPRPRAAEQRRGRFAANDDRRPVGASMQRRPSRLIYPTAAVLSAAWAIFVVGSFVVQLLDRTWRAAHGLASPTWLFFGVHGILAIVALVLAFRATGSVRWLWLRWVLVALQAAVGFVVFAFMMIAYSCSLGDCF